MNIIRFLRYQHHEAKLVLNEIIDRSGASDVRSLLEKLSKMLRLHMQIEEMFVYPVASRCFQGDLSKPSVLQSFDEHELAKQCLAALESTPPNDEHFVPRAKVLRGILHEHILEEESDMFPSLEAKLGLSGIERLGDDIEREFSSKLEVESASRPASAAGAEGPAKRARSAKVAQARRAATKSGRAKVPQTRRPAAKSQGAKVARPRRPGPKTGSAKVAPTRRPATTSSGAKVAQARRQRSTVRGAKGSRRRATAGRSTTRH